MGVNNEQSLIDLAAHYSHKLWSQSLRRFSTFCLNWNK